MKTVIRKTNNKQKLAADGSGRMWDFLDRHRIWYINVYFYRIKWPGQLSQIRVPEKRSLKNKQKPNQTRIANLGIRLRLKVHFVFDKWRFHFMKTLYLFTRKLIKSAKYFENIKGDTFSRCRTPMYSRENIHIDLHLLLYAGSRFQIHVFNNIQYHSRYTW